MGLLDIIAGLSLVSEEIATLFAIMAALIYLPIKFLVVLFLFILASTSHSVLGFTHFHRAEVYLIVVLICPYG